MPTVEELGREVSDILLKGSVGIWLWLRGASPEQRATVTEGLEGAWETTLRDPATAGSLLAAKAMFDFALHMNSAFGVVYAIRNRTSRVEMTRSKEQLKQVMLSVPYEDFKLAWQTARQLVDLQGRLLLEQCFWELGGRWRTELVTGFKPVQPTEHASSEGEGGVTPQPYVIPFSKRHRGP